MGRPSLRHRFVVALLVSLGVVIGFLGYRVHLSLAAAGVAFQGVVNDPNGNPVEGAFIGIFPLNISNPTPVDGAQTNASGQFQIPDSGITQGVTYRFEVFPPPGSSYLSPAAKQASYSGTTVDLGTFQFATPTKTITGTVTYSGGGNVANAQVNAFKSDGFGFVQTTTNASGQYTLQVGGGKWEVMPQASSSSDWAYGQPPTSVKFANDTSSESQTVNFVVDRATATVTGRLLKPGGSPVTSSDNLGVGVFSMEGKGSGTQITSNDGTFSVNVPAGSYMFNVWAPPNSNYGAPNVTPFSVADGDIKDLGDITLVTKSATIQGTVTDGNGNPVANLVVEAFSRSGGGFSEGQTDANGQFQIKVTAGTWMVMPRLSPTSSYALDSNPQEVQVSANQTVTYNISLTNATATIQGTVVDSNGSPVSVYGFAFAQVNGSNFGPGGLGGPVERGSFSFKVPPGTYSVNIGLPPGSSYTPGDSQTVTVSDGQTQNITLTVKSNTATIQGTIKDENGNPVTANMHVFAVSSNNTFQEGQVSNGSYSISVAAGTWSLGYFIDPSTGYISAPPDPSLRFSVKDGETKTENITLTKANSTISGTVTQPDGSAATGVFVSVETSGVNRRFVAGSPTDSNGNYSINVSDGTYLVRANVAPNSGYLSPAEQQVTVSGSNATQNFTLRTANATITGTVKLNGSGVAAFVYAWSDDGGFSQAQADSSGQFSLSVSSGTTWHVGAFYQSNTTPYQATEVAIDPSSGNTADLTLSQASFTLPSPVSFTFDATKPKLITLDDGTTINIPANAMATSGNVTLTVNPKATLPAQKQGKPVWYGYEFKAFNASGQSITQFNSNITITFPYDPNILTQLGLTPSDLVPSYWDSTSGTWKKVGNVTIDSSANTVTISVNHFTDFALTTPTDSTSSSSSTSDTTTSSTSSSSTSTSSGGDSKPVDVAAKQGRVIKRDNLVFIVSPDTFDWDAYLTLTTTPKGHPYQVRGYWQVSPVYDIWFKASFNDAKIVAPNKDILISFGYRSYWLDQLPERSLKVAFSQDKDNWQILPTSVLDMGNKTVAALHKAGGYYMLVAGWGPVKTTYTGDKTWLPADDTFTPTITPTPTHKLSEDQSPAPAEPVVTTNPQPTTPQVYQQQVEVKKPWWRRLLDKLLGR